MIGAIYQVQLPSPARLVCCIFALLVSALMVVQVCDVIFRSRSLQSPGLEAGMW